MEEKRFTVRGGDTMAHPVAENVPGSSAGNSGFVNNSMSGGHSTGNGRRYRAVQTALVVLAGIVLCLLGLVWAGLRSQGLSSEIVVNSHRGYSAAATENTIPAFKMSIAAGAECAELDVQMTKDGVAVLTHDTNLRRCTGLDANVYDLTYAQIEQLDAGSYFSKRFTGTKIPTLKQVLRLCKGRIKLNIEIKPSAQTPTLEEEVVRLIQEEGFEDDCTITSKSLDTLAQIKALAPEIRTGYITHSGFLGFHDQRDVDFYSIENGSITVLTIWQAHLRGKTFSAWTVNRQEEIDRMIRLGVDDIITDNPAIVQNALRRRKTIEADFDLWDLLQEYYPVEDDDTMEDA